MAFEFPIDSIKNLQITLRKEAGVPSYDPEDPKLLDLPSLEETISQIDPSPPYLRCKQCRGRLLRGIQSIVCVYCGSQQQREIPPDPISFKSTFGYRWLLESLDLDGSEAIDSNKGQNASKDTSVLSDLFNLELKWPADSEKNGSNFADKAPHQIKNPLNLAGVDLDSFFSETKKETVPSVFEEQLISKEQIKSTETHAFSGQGGLSLFENAQSSNTVERSSEGAVDDPFSDWEPEFQSARVGTLPMDSKSTDLFSDSSPIDLPSPMETAFGSEGEMKFEFNHRDNDVKENKDLVPPASMSDSWIQDDQWPTSIMESANKIAQPEMKSKVDNDGKATHNSNNSSSMLNNFFQEDIWPTGSEKISKNEDSSDAWQDFTSSGNAPDSSQSSLKLTSTKKTSTDEHVSEMNMVSLNNFQDMEFGSFMSPDPFSGASSLHNGSTVMNTVQEASMSDRLVEVMTGGDIKSRENVNESSDAAMWSESTDNTVETLMAQMHDLSFMLETNLSVPTKEEDSVNSI